MKAGTPAQRELPLGVSWGAGRGGAWSLHPSEMPRGQWVLGSDAQERGDRGEEGLHELTRVGLWGECGKERDQTKLCTHRRA